MDVMFRDRMLACTECGNQFVFTIGQQRMAYLDDGMASDPLLCPVCEVKQARGSRQTAPREEGLNGGRSNGNGAHHAQPIEELFPSPFAYTGAQPNGHARARGRTQRRAADEPSPNRPDDYRSGPEHPLFGHQGESYLGRVKWFNDRKGFGFIVLDNGIELFVHYSGIVGEGYKTLVQNQPVQVIVEDTDKGPQACQVIPLGQPIMAAMERMAMAE